MSYGSYSLDDVFPDMEKVSKAPSLEDLEARCGDDPRKLYGLILKEQSKQYKAISEGVVYFVDAPCLLAWQARQHQEQGKKGPTLLTRRIPERKGLIKDLVGGGKGRGKRGKDWDSDAQEANF